jgi:rubrerythrin
LEHLFSQKYPTRKVELPDKSFLPPIKVKDDAEPSIMNIFKAALQAEKLSEEFYKERSREAGSDESQKLLEYLSRVERGHYFMIKSEIDLLEKFPDYYDVEEFHFSHEMVHLGP